ncbi:DNA/RNA nuclease SfsA [Candidatus Pelagibacter bacterium]|nr:DNA/RNA nuclease SfsA [Candidatus Pelagibacter bacterium]|tara:strand:- start:1409 stop:2104 length:696 start_codon:yes stop_codon:yes gene_type:complete
MNFENKLISGQLIKRYKRFFVDVKINSKIITAHCPNTGSMYGLLKKNNKVWLTESNNPNRKLKYTLQIIKEKNSKVGVNTHLTNKIVYHALENNLIDEFNKKIKIKPESKFGTNTRFDFLITKNNTKTFIEVKNVTLSRTKGVAEFPDAVTARGLKHIKELIKAAKKGYKIYILYLIQRDDCKFFKIAEDIDPEYSKLLSKAVKKKLNVLCYDCKFSPKGIKLNHKVKFKI